MLRPLPPFRAKPSRKPRVPKHEGRHRRNESETVAVKAQRHPVKLARLAAAPELKVLSRTASV